MIFLLFISLSSSTGGSSFFLCAFLGDSEGNGRDLILFDGLRLAAGNGEMGELPSSGSESKDAVLTTDCL